MNLRHERKFKQICAHSFRGTCARRSGLQVGDDVSNRKGIFCGLDWEYTLGRQIPPSGTWRMHVRTLSKWPTSIKIRRVMSNTPAPYYLERKYIIRILASSYYACLRRCFPNVILSSLILSPYAHVSSGTRGLDLDFLHPYFVNASSEGAFSQAHLSLRCPIMCVGSCYLINKSFGK